MSFLHVVLYKRKFSLLALVQGNNEIHQEFETKEMNKKDYIKKILLILLQAMPTLKNSVHLTIPWAGY